MLDNYYYLHTLDRLGYALYRVGTTTHPTEGEKKINTHTYTHMYNSYTNYSTYMQYRRRKEKKHAHIHIHIHIYNILIQTST